MVDIIGGTYYESCVDPHWSELFGSGLRAVNALANLGPSINFHTYADKETTETLKYFAEALIFNLFVTSIEKNVEFEYNHPLAEPFFSPPLWYFNKLKPIHLKSENTIVFGMLEGNAIIKGTKVVYDPQSPGYTKSFKQNGSEAEELIIVLNLTEAMNLAKEREIIKIANYIFQNEGAIATIIKMGPLGAYLFKKESVLEPHYISPYITERVWPIGSGDIFTSVFGYEWMVNNTTLEIAAEKASLATAYYVNSQTLPIPNQISHQFPIFRKKDVVKKLYLAGPFFTMAQRWLVNEFRDNLIKMNVEVFSPMHDVGFGEAGVVATADLVGLETCDMVLAIVDGLDSGTLFEIGYAKSRGISVLVFAENEKEESLTMLKGTGCIFISDFSTAIYTAYWKLYNDEIK